MSNPAYRPGPLEGVSEEVQACCPSDGSLHAYVWWAAQTTHAPPWWHVATGLAAIAHEAARHGYVIGAEQQMRPMLWVALLGPSAAGKSTAIGRAIDFYRSHLASTNARDPFVMAEGSIPGIFEKLTEGWDEDVGRTLGILHQEELSRLLDSKDTVAEMLMQLADGRDIERHKVSSRAAARQGQNAHDKLVNPTLSATVATTYSSLRRVTKAHHIEGGLYSRLLWFIAEPDPHRLQMLPTPRPAQFRAALDEWRQWQGWILAEEVVGAPKVIDVPEQVHSILEDSLFEALKQKIRGDDRLNATRMRAVMQAYLIAGLFAFSQRRTTVLSDDMDQAVNLVERCTAGLERIDPELGGNEIMQLVNVGFRAIQARGTAGLKRNELYAALKSSKGVVEQVLGTLIDEGSVREVTLKTGKRGRPPTAYVACGPTRFLGQAEPGDPVVPLRKSKEP